MSDPIAAAASSEEILKEQMDAILQDDQMPFDGNGSAGAVDPNDAQAFQNYVRGDDPVGGVPSGDTFSSAEARRSMDGIYDRAQNTIGRLDGQLTSARRRGADYEGRLSNFVSTVRRRMERMSSVVNEIVAKKDLSQQDLMRIQYEVMEMSIVLDVASKVGDKGSQALQTLFRDK
jgi:hypothetical protein